MSDRKDKLLVEVLRAAEAVADKGHIITRDMLGSFESGYYVYEYLFMDLVNALEKYKRGGLNYVR